MNIGFRFGCALLLLSAVACGGPDTGRPTGGPVLQFAVTATTTNADEVALGADTAALNVDAAWISLRSLEVVPCSRDSAPISNDDQALDLAHDPPAVLAFETGVGDYCALRVAVGPSPAADPAELEDLSLHVLGTRSDDVAFEVRSTLELDVELRSDTTFDSRHLVVGFDLAVWFTGADVQGASATDGVAVIDSSSNTAVLMAFEANAAPAVALYDDADRDGILDEDELVPLATAP